MRIGIVSDVHCQHAALAAAFDAMGPVEHIICLGDCIDQSRFCDRTIALLRKREVITIRGNHDDGYLASKAARNAKDDDGHLRWLAARPDRLRLVLGGQQLLVVHSNSWSSEHPYVGPDHPEFGNFAKADADIILYGHTHQPVVRRVDGKLIVNPGSVGEGRPGPAGFVRSFAVLDLDQGEVDLIDLD